jgi:nicotinamide-nucleotide amidase
MTLPSPPSRHAAASAPPFDTPPGTASEPLSDWVGRLAEALTAHQWRMATAESCTGGGIASACTDRAGSSDWLERGWVTYSNRAKHEELGVPVPMLDSEGAVSEPVARAMAEGAAQAAGVAVSLSVTGVAGPTGGTDDKPVGTVWFGWHLPGRTWTECRHFVGDRAAVRRRSVRHALETLVLALEDSAVDRTP